MPEMDAQTSTVEFSEHSIGQTTSTWDRNSEETPVYGVVSAVAEASGTDPLELPPLADVVDPEALNDLFTARAEPTVDRISFQYAGYDVVVRGSGEIAVRDPRDD